MIAWWSPSSSSTPASSTLTAGLLQRLGSEGGYDGTSTPGRLSDTFTDERYPLGSTYVQTEDEVKQRLWRQAAGLRPAAGRADLDLRHRRRLPLVALPPGRHRDPSWTPTIKAARSRWWGSPITRLLQAATADHRQGHLWAPRRPVGAAGLLHRMATLLPAGHDRQRRGAALKVIGEGLEAEAALWRTTLRPVSI